MSQVDDPVEALDAAAVEAALSLCEDPAVGGHPLTSPWESQTFKAAEPEANVQESAVVPVAPEAVPELVQGEMEVLEETEKPEVADGVTEDPAVTAPDAEQRQDCEVKMEAEREGEGGMEEAPEENRTPSPAVKCEREDWVQPETVTPCLDSEDSSASAKDAKVHICIQFGYVISI